MQLFTSHLKNSSIKSPWCSFLVYLLGATHSTSSHKHRITKKSFHIKQVNVIIISYTKTTISYHKKQVLKSFYPFNTIVSTVSDNSINIHYVEIFNNMVSAHYTFISLLINTTIPITFSPFSNIHPIQIIHTTPTIPTILSKN